MKISLSTGSVYFYPLRTTFALAKELGFDGVELVVDHELHLRGPAYVRELSREYELPVFSLHPPLLRLRRPESLSAALLEMVELAGEIGCSVVVSHLPNMDDLESAKGQAYLGALAKVRSRAADLGMEFAPENSAFFPADGPYLWDEPEAATRFCEEQDLSLTLDTAHAASWGWDVLETYELFRGRLANVHLSDMRESRPLLDYSFLHTHTRHHQILGAGDLPLDRLIARLARDGYDGLVTLEIGPLALRIWWPPAVKRGLARCLKFVRRHARETPGRAGAR